jgi:hypothetical protein
MRAVGTRPKILPAALWPAPAVAAQPRPFSETGAHDAQATTKPAVAVLARRSLLLRGLDVEGPGVAIRLGRMKPSDGDPVRVFSRRTAENIDARHALSDPSRFEMALPEAMGAEAFWGLKLGERSSACADGVPRLLRRPLDPAADALGRTSLGSDAPGDRLALAAPARDARRALDGALGGRASSPSRARSTRCGHPPPF